MKFTSKFSIARIPFTNTEQDFGNKNSSIHELHKITRELKVTSFLEFPAPKKLTTRNAVRDKQTILSPFIELTN